MSRSKKNEVVQKLSDVADGASMVDVGAGLSDGTATPGEPAVVHPATEGPAREDVVPAVDGGATGGAEAPAGPEDDEQVEDGSDARVEKTAEVGESSLSGLEPATGVEVAVQGCAAPSGGGSAVGGGDTGEPEAPADPEETFRCEECDEVIRSGDKICDLDDGGMLCEHCAPKWGELLERPAAFDVSEAEAKGMVDQHLAAGGSLDDPYVGFTKEDASHVADAIAYMLAAETDRSRALLAAPIAAAEAAAYVAMDVAQTRQGEGDRACKLLPDEDMAKYVCGLTEAAAFIRIGGPRLDGPVFWNHLSLGGFHADGLNSWLDLSFALRLGWSTFGAVLLAYDHFAAEDDARARQPEPTPVRSVPIEDTTLEIVDGVLDRFDDKR